MTAWPWRGLSGHAMANGRIGSAFSTAQGVSVILYFG